MERFACQIREHVERQFVIVGVVGEVDAGKNRPVVAIRFTVRCASHGVHVAGIDPFLSVVVGIDDGKQIEFVGSQLHFERQTDKEVYCLLFRLAVPYARYFGFGF